MPDFPAGSPHYYPHTVGTYQSLALEFSNLGSVRLGTGAWPTSNLAIFVPLALQTPFLVKKMFVWNSTVVSGNIDVGVYAMDGTRIVSSGTTAHAGTSQAQSFDVTDTLLAPGTYYLAAALDNTTGIIDHLGTSANNSRMIGILQMAAAFPLPAIATFAVIASAYVPLVDITNHTVI